MTLNELKNEALKQGYVLVKKNDYDCSCCLEYPAKNRCGEKYECIGKSKNGHFTYCKRRGA